MNFLSVDDGSEAFVSSVVFIRSFKAFFIFDLSLLLCLTNFFLPISLDCFSLASSYTCLDLLCSADVSFGRVFVIIFIPIISFLF